MDVKIIRMPPIGDTDSAKEHDRQKWYRLLGFVEGSPESTWKTVSVPVSAIVSGRKTREAVKEKLTKDVKEFYANWLEIEGE